MTGRPMTEQQERRLVMAHQSGFTLDVQRSVPSLVRRGFVEGYWRKSGGRRFRTWRVTEAGHAEVRRIRERREARP